MWFVVCAAGKLPNSRRAAGGEGRAHGAAELWALAGARAPLASVVTSHNPGPLNSGKELEQPSEPGSTPGSDVTAFLCNFNNSC